MLRLPRDLDPEIGAMLIASSQTTGQEIADLPLAEARAGYAERYLARGLPPAEGVDTAEVAIPTVAGSLPARLYRGQQGGALALYFHGGGFVIGSVAAYDAQSRNLAAMSGVNILSIDYRLAPEHPFPAAIEDARRAAKWAIDHAAELGADPARVGFVGDSAGGAISLVTALALPGRIRGVLASYPVTDLGDLRRYASARMFGEGFFLDLRLLERFTRLYLPEGTAITDPRVSVLHAATLATLPPTLIVTAGADPLRDQGEAFAQKALAQGAPVSCFCETAMIHNFMGHGAVSAAAAEAFRRNAARLRHLLV